MRARRPAPHQCPAHPPRLRLPNEPISTAGPTRQSTDSTASYSTPPPSPASPGPNSLTRRTLPARPPRLRLPNEPISTAGPTSQSTDSTATYSTLRPSPPCPEPNPLTRRTLLAAFAAPSRVSREVFLPSPGRGAAVIAQAFYTRPTGGELRSLEQRLSRSDTIDAARSRVSHDHGRSWTPPVEQRTGERRPQGMWRMHPRPAYLDPASGRLIDFWIEGVLPTDNPLEGMRQWTIHCRVEGGA